MQDLFGFRKSIAAGVLIAMASYLFLKAEAPLGALLFGFGLSFVCLFKLELFTGKIGYFGQQNLPYLKILLGNLIGCALVCALFFWDEDTRLVAQNLIAIKSALPWYTALIKGIFCGVLMFLAVYSWSKGFRSGCFLCVSVFILSGLEHSIADFAYMGFAWHWCWNFIWIVLGNALGAVGCRLLVQEQEATN